MHYHFLRTAGDGRNLCVGFDDEGVEFAVCTELGNAENYSPDTSVRVPRTTPAWIGYALRELNWDLDDFHFIVDLTADPRLETPAGHISRPFCLELPSHIRPNDGYRQAGSVWWIEDGRYAPCISPQAQNPRWWGEQLASAIGNGACDFAETDGMSVSDALKLSVSGFNQMIVAYNHGKFGAWSASRSAWADSPRKFEVISLWADGSGNPVLTLAKGHSCGSLIGQQVACLLIAAVDTLKDELGLDHSVVRGDLMEGFAEKMRWIEAVVERDDAQASLQ